MATKTEELPAQAADAATGAAAEVVNAASDPVGTTTKQVRRLERRGAPINRQVGRQVRKAAGQAAEATTKLIDGSVAEQLVIRSLHAVKARARRRDLVGEAAFRSLELLHSGFGTAAKRLARFQDASQPPARSEEPARPDPDPRRQAAKRDAGPRGGGDHGFAGTHQRAPQHAHGSDADPQASLT